MNKALVLAGGKGSRFSKDEKGLPKPMINLGEYPIIENIILLLKSIGFNEIYIVVGFKKELIINYFENGSKYGLKITYIDNKYINEKNKSGLSDAVLLAKDYINEPFLTILGDEIYVRTRHKEMISEFLTSSNIETMIGIYETDNIEEVKKNYSVKLDSNNFVINLEEKPKNPWNNLIGCGTYIFKPTIYEYIEKTPFSEKSGRKELADTMKLILQDNKKIKAYRLCGHYININYEDDLVKARKLLMK